MKKVRVKQIGEMYYPQYRFMFIWNNFQKMVSMDEYETVRFSTLEKATKYAKGALIKVHEVTL